MIHTIGSLEKSSLLFYEKIVTFLQFGCVLRGSESAPSFFRLVFLHLLSRICYTEATFLIGGFHDNPSSPAPFHPGARRFQPRPRPFCRGLQRAAAVFQNDAFRTVSLVWSSPSLRALQTAQLLGLPVRQDTRLAERRTGDTTGQDASFWKRQYEDPDFKNPDGESFREVSARMADCIHELLDSLPEGQNALVVSHAAAICSYLQRFCTIEVTDAAQKLRRITFQGEVLLDGHFWEADGFVLHIENRRPVLIRTI